MIEVNFADYLNLGDPSHALQTAIGDAVQSGHAIGIPGGNFEFPRAIKIPGSTGLQICGPGWGGQLSLAHNVDDYLFVLGDDEVRGFVLRDVRLNGNCDYQSDGGGIWAAGAVHCHFERVWFHGFYDYAIRTDKIRNAGVFAHHNHLTGCLIDGGSGSGGLGSGFFNFGADENFIRDTDFEDLGNPFFPESGGVIDTSGLTTVTGGSFVNCRDGYRVKDTGRVAMIGVKFDGNKRYAAVISGDECKLANSSFLEGPAGMPYVLLNNGGGNAITANDATTPQNRMMRSFVQETGGAKDNIVAMNVLKLQAYTERLGFERNQPTTGIWRDNIVRQAQ